MRSFRTISAILAATAPAGATRRPAEQEQRTAPTITPATRQIGSEPLKDQYSTSVPAVLARIQSSANVNSVLIRSQHGENMQPELRMAQNTTDSANNNYQILNSLLSLGQIQQARLILPIIQQELAAQHRSDNTNRMVDAYVQLLKQYSMTEEAKFIQNTAAQQATV